ncbi:MAG TPA: Hsp20/alpha crystallin family protein [Anaerolineaceae bacterium]|jgi:HSP20 family protein|nr:Hsp20/alpha crystallin family protein [Anaerolineaceae bacterium]
MSYFVYTPFGRAAHMRRMREFFDEDMPFSEREVMVPIDVRAENDDFIVTALVPGLKPEDLNIQVINETVTLSGELKLYADEKANYIHKECPYGKFHRTITLPSTLDALKAEANVENGVLTLRVPKAEEAKPKTIKVSIAK